MTKIRRSEWLALLLMTPVILPLALVLVFYIGLSWADTKWRNKFGVN